MSRIFIATRIQQFRHLLWGFLLPLFISSVYAQSMMPTLPNNIPGQSNVSTTIPLTGATGLQSGAPVLVKQNNGPGTQTRSLACQDFYNGPTAGVIYGGGPVTEIRTQTPGGWSAWQVSPTSLPCTRTYTQTQTAACVAGQQGVLTQERIYTLNDQGVTISDSGWVNTGSTCAYYNTGSQTQTQTLACPDNENGSIIYSRTYDLWSDGSTRNYSAWAIQSSTCTSQQASIGYNYQALTCPSGQDGAVIQQQTYSISSTGVQSNFSAWNTIASTCKAYEAQYLTEYESLSNCPANQIGTNTYSQQYWLWTDGSTTNYSGWSFYSSDCHYYDTGQIGYNYMSTGCPPNQAGQLNYYNTSNIWSDGSWRNTSGWVQYSGSCDYYDTGQIGYNYMSTGCPPGQAGSIDYYNTSNIWSDGSWRNTSGWNQSNYNCYIYPVGGSQNCWGGSPNCPGGLAYDYISGVCDYFFNYTGGGSATYCQDFTNWSDGSQTPSSGVYQTSNSCDTYQSGYECNGGDGGAGGGGGGD